MRSGDYILLLLIVGGLAVGGWFVYSDEQRLCKYAPATLLTKPQSSRCDALAAQRSLEDRMEEAIRSGRTPR